MSSVPSSRSLLKQHRKSFPQLASTFSGCRATERNSRGSLIHHILSFSSLLPLPFPTLIENLTYLFNYPLEELPVSGRIPDSSQGLAGWEENGRKNRSKETMTGSKLPLARKTCVYVVWAFTKCFGSRRPDYFLFYSST